MGSLPNFNSKHIAVVYYFARKIDELSEYSRGEILFESSQIGCEKLVITDLGGNVGWVSLRNSIKQTDTARETVGKQAKPNMKPAQPNLRIAAPPNPL